MASSICKRQTRPLVREGAPQKQDHNCQTIINILLTDWLTVSRNVTLTLTSTQLVVSCQLRAELDTGCCEDRTWAREAEKSPLLEAVARERPMKAQQAGKGLSGCCGDLKRVEISDSVVITYNYECCVYVVNKCIHQSIPHLFAPLNYLMMPQCRHYIASADKVNH
jgi:hypothetical protein